MNKKIGELLQDGFNIRIFQTFIIICFIYLAVIVWKWRTLPPELPLYYSLPRGNEQIGTPLEFLILPFFSIILFLFHFMIAVMLYSWEKIAAKILLVAALITSIAFLLTFIRIVVLIT